jgi:hypothetical protein
MARLRFSDGVVFVPPARPEEAEERWQRWVEAMDWLAAIGARGEDDVALFDFGMVAVQYDPNGSWHISFASGHRWDGWLDGWSRISPALND